MSFVHATRKERYARMMARARLIAFLSAGALVLILLSYSFIFGPVNSDDTVTREVIVSPGDTLAGIADTLQKEGLAKHWFALPFAAWVAGENPSVRPGGYKIAPSMDVWMILHAFKEAPYLSWVEVPQGLRKEEIVALLAEEFDWSEDEQQEFLSERSISPDLEEGAYFSDTYLMPSDSKPSDVAKRLRSKFEDVYAPYAHWASMEGMTWNEVITFASIIEREAGRNDKKLVAGILKNRLDTGMRLQADATLQYVTGNKEEGWWHAPSSQDKFLDSPFNTYMYEGLPPSPIASPALSSIEAVLDPEETSCMYYLHDAEGDIHCAVSYEQHLRNIEYYLR